MAQPPPYPTQPPAYPSKEAEAAAAPAYPPGAAYPPATGAAYPPPAQPAPVAAAPMVAQPAAQPAAAVVVTSTVTSGFLGHYPCTTVCPHCAATMTTRVVHTPGAMAWLACLFIAFVGGWLGCCLIPFCIPGMQDTIHYCTNCNRQIGAARQL